MAKQSNQKLKILHILRLLEEQSDEQNPISTPKIISYLEGLGINAERKSVYADIEALKLFGVDIISTGKNGYYIGSRDFETAELKLLSDCVQANRFITEKKSASLIKKLESLTSKKSARELQRQVYITTRVKNVNEKIYYNTDTLHEAISKNRQIVFKYFTYTPDKQKVYKRDGENYTVYPYALTVSEENYYLVAYYGTREKITNFRVDRMEDIKILDTFCPPIENVAGEAFNLGEYVTRTFNMFTGEPVTVTVKCKNHLINAVIDRFSDKIPILKTDDEHFIFKAKVGISPSFFSWIFMFGGEMEIIEPATAKEEFGKMIKIFKI